MEKLLSSKEVMAIAGKGTRVFQYPHLNNLVSINQVVNDLYPKAIILYQMEQQGNTISGHWIGFKKVGNSLHIKNEF